MGIRANASLGGTLLLLWRTEVVLLILSQLKNMSSNEPKLCSPFHFVAKGKSPANRIEPEDQPVVLLPYYSEGCCVKFLHLLLL